MPVLKQIANGELYLHGSSVSGSFVVSIKYKMYNLNRPLKNLRLNYD